MPTEDEIRSALSHVKYPGFSRDIVSFGLIKSVLVDGKNIQVDISFATRDPNVPRPQTAAAGKVTPRSSIELAVMRMRHSSPPAVG